MYNMFVASSLETAFHRYLPRTCAREKGIAAAAYRQI